jgi:hypothetical protein
MNKDIQNKRIKILDFFKKLEFNEEKHSYLCDNISYSSVSKFIGSFTEKFDEFKIAGYVAKSRKTTIDVILKEWKTTRDNACNKGHRVHHFGENYMFDRDIDPTDGYEEAIIKFWNDLPDHLVPFIAELKMYSKDKKLAGTADIILYNIKTGKFRILDYKTNVDLFKNFKGKKMLKQFKKYLDSPYNKYILQLSAYQYLFELSGFEVEARTIVWLRENGEYQLYNTPNVIKELFNEN